MIRKSLCLTRYYISNFNTNKDYYKILNVSQNATNQQIKKSFRTLAKKYHPDANKGNEQKFKQLNEAYQVLSSQSTKRDYDDARKGPQQSHQSNYTYNPNSGYQTHYQQHQYYRQDPSRQNTYRGYQQQTGWNNRNFRQETIRNMFYKQQQQFMKQNYSRANRAQQQHNDDLLHKRSGSSSQFSSRNLEDELDEMLKKSSQQIKITRQSVRKAYQQQQKRREQDFKRYQDKQNQDIAKQIKDRAWKMAEGVKDNVDGLVKVGKYVKQNLQAASKVGKLAKSLWDQFKNTNKK